MKGMLILADADVRPELFHWFGAPSPDALEAWLCRHGLDGRLPPELLALLQRTGGGDLFESETILGPLGSEVMGDDIVGVTESYRRRGLPSDVWIFQTGCFLCGFTTDRFEYVRLDERSLTVVQRFLRLDDWYIATLRAEFGERYGLAPMRGQGLTPKPDLGS